MRKRVISLWGMIMICGLLMGMSHVQISQLKEERGTESVAEDATEEKTVLAPLVTEISRPENGCGIYNDREKAVFTLELDESGTGSYSPAVRFGCCVTDGSGYEQTEVWELNGKFSVTYQPDLSVFADGDVQFDFYAQDQAGNVSQVKTQVLKKDSTRPVITGRMETTGHRNGDYYSDSCQIYLFVEDAHLDLSWRPVVESEGSENYSFSGWQKNGNVAEGVLTFSEEGKYQVTFACTDQAGNQAETLSVPMFIIDRTAPVISVVYDDQACRNAKYYQKSRKAVITIAEEWFRPEDGKVIIHFDDKESDISSLKWTKTEAGYVSEVLFEEDGIHALSVMWTDPAGNNAKAYHSGAFVIDSESPEVVIKNIANYSSNNDKVEPVIQINDENIDEGEIKISLKEMTGKKVEMPTLHERKTSAHEVTVDFDNFGKEMDGIYQLSVSAQDLSGNRAEKSVFFTVNRNGSYYAFSRETEEMFRKVFIQKPEKVIIFEQNMDWLTEANVMMSCNGDVRELKKDRDYTVQVVGGSKARKEYTYTINEGCFDQEGTYLFYIDSKDRASNYSSIDQSGEKAGFILDRTAPNLKLINLQEQQYYHESSHNFQVTVDDNTEIDSVRYYLDGKLEEQFSSEQIQEMEGLLELQTKASDEYQTIQVVAEDKAGNIADTGEWHVLVNTSARTKKKNSDRYDQNSQEGRYTELKTQDLRGKRMAIVLAGMMAAVFIAVGWRMHQKRKVSIRRLPDTDDRR